MSGKNLSVTYTRLSDIAKRNLSQIGSMTLHSTPEEYCVNREYLTEEDAKRVNAEIRRQQKSFGKLLDFPLMAHQMGLLNEAKTIDTITHFKTIEIIPSAKVEEEQVTFRLFNYAYCKKKRFFEYISPYDDEHYFYVSITHSSVFPESVKRYISHYKMRVTLPDVIDKMLDAAYAAQQKEAAEK